MLGKDPPFSLLFLSLLMALWTAPSIPSSAELIAFETTLQDWETGADTQVRALCKELPCWDTATELSRGSSVRSSCSNALEHLMLTPKAHPEYQEALRGLQDQQGQ